MKLKRVKISDCLHYRGFRYGGYGNNIYEDYIIGMSCGASIGVLRQQLLNRVLSLDGKYFGSVLNVDLERNYPPWRYPWNFRSIKLDFAMAYSPASNPDIVCHSSPDGVLASHINREFVWLERAYYAMQNGYRPKEFGYIRLLSLGDGGRRRYIVLDGNHRIASMTALGYEYMEAEVVDTGIRFKRLARMWPGVFLGSYTLRDAHLIFERYFMLENICLSEEKIQKLLIDEPLIM